jgi:hypothetical protein
MKALGWMLACVAGLGLAMPAHAVGRLIDVNIVDRDTGATLLVYKYHGRYYVAGEPGHRYRVDLRNPGDDAVLGVLSIDGVNAITGDTASWLQSGYVLDAYRSFSVLGWRKSNEQVAGFLFTDLGASYAARTGRPDNVGVIGVAVFRRRPPAPAMAEAALAEAAPAPAAPAADSATAQRAAKAVGGPLGTGHGQREASVVQTVDFDRASDTPEEVVAIYYDTRARLLAQGVIPGTAPRQPQPFPGHFVPDP